MEIIKMSDRLAWRVNVCQYSMSVVGLLYIMAVCVFAPPPEMQNTAHAPNGWVGGGGSGEKRWFAGGGAWGPPGAAGPPMALRTTGE